MFQTGINTSKQKIDDGQWHVIIIRWKITHLYFADLLPLQLQKFCLVKCTEYESSLSIWVNTHIFISMEYEMLLYRQGSFRSTNLDGIFTLHHFVGFVWDIVITMWDYPTSFGFHFGLYIWRKNLETVALLRGRHLPTTTIGITLTYHNFWTKK